MMGILNDPPKWDQAPCLVCFKLGQLLGRSDQPLGGTFVHTNSGKTWEGPKPGRETSLGTEAPAPRRVMPKVSSASSGP